MSPPSASAGAQAQSQSCCLPVRRSPHRSLPLSSPLSKTVRFNVLKVEETALDAQAARKQFRMF